MGCKEKPFAATHYVKNGNEIIYIMDNVISWMYWNDFYREWYRYDYSYGDPKQLEI